VRALAVLWSLGTVLALWMPPPDTPGLDWPWLDKAVHFGLFGGAAVLWRLSGAGLVEVALGIVAGAALTELGQGMLPWPRTPDALDFTFDLAGATLGVAGLGGARALVRRRTHRSGATHDDAPGAPEASWRNGRDSNPR
jgi:hypothetical protein